ncbi:MAG: hypothetical protein A2087_13935 [Spirochaetes bacterium GWD1_61_31]|nr:MAG: hypothetical protein A2Y37_04850 [Spirochaetes bacterium GWB1_60_80]OHD41883.1 MAG: hypothetical protein A2087_13935 [Spirochaetes bacterium GWD1_61_31]OHD43708.1 MAG: hypothetical protein A2Y35_00045 [Spirochaetes bacterium GWE1_60_18]OHD60189.1 MAG: hypothetical protein A2Y32_07090 [Spirochaetes bacterium GWF1_60_12]HAP42536.1 RluA family pseudouridine synthase [Spirochaetaceae bacterium]
MIPLLFSNDDFLIIDKPAGLAVQPGAGVKLTVLEAMERDYGLKTWLVHRLDKETAGCLLLARSARAAQDLSQLLQGHQVEKTYRLLVFGQPAPASGSLISPVRVQGKQLEALTHYRWLDSWPCRSSLSSLPGDQGSPAAFDISLVEATLSSGRMHQIRQQFATAGWPLMGDDKYGNFKLNRLAAKQFGVKRLFLYACRLRLPFQPPVVAAASLPPHFAAFFQASGWLPKPDGGQP